MDGGSRHHRGGSHRCKVVGGHEVVEVETMHRGAGVVDDGEKVVVDPAGSDRVEVAMYRLVRVPSRPSATRWQGRMRAKSVQM